MLKEKLRQKWAWFFSDLITGLIPIQDTIHEGKNKNEFRRKIL